MQNGFRSVEVNSGRAATLSQIQDRKGHGGPVERNQDFRVAKNEHIFEVAVVECGLR
jgi:hypothetical protein